jgi:hypothetical protein
MSRFNKDEALAQIRRAKLSHVRWRAYAQSLVAGISVDEERVPVRDTACQFGQWYHGAGTEQLGQLECFRKVGAPHEALHAVYAEIYNLVQKHQLEQAAGRLEELVTVSRILLELIDGLESEVIRL